VGRGRTTIDDLLAESRAGISRPAPAAAAAAVRERGAVLVDIRSGGQRRAQGVVAGAAWIPRNVLEWRLDPDSGATDPRFGDLDAELILFCSEGYASSLAAATLRRLGFARATDMDGGFEAWAAAGLPVDPA
jgi:rhodanese-related sulfurtransferase